jgi:hypothetical protein
VDLEFQGAQWEDFRSWGLGDMTETKQSLVGLEQRLKDGLPDCRFLELPTRIKGMVRLDG